MRQNRLGGGLTSRREPEKTQKVSDSHRNDVSPLTQGLRYRAACDNFTTPTEMHISLWIKYRWYPLCFLHMLLQSVGDLFRPVGSTVRRLSVCSTDELATSIEHRRHCLSHHQSHVENTYTTSTPVCKVCFRGLNFNSEKNNDILHNE